MFKVIVLLELFYILVILTLIGCTHTAPKPFVIGEEVEPPYGCIEYRKRGGEC